MTRCFSSQVGIHDYDDLLDDLSFTAYARRLAKCEELLARIEALEPTLVEHTDVLNVNVLRDELQVFIDGYPFKKLVLELNNNKYKLATIRKNKFKRNCLNLKLLTYFKV